MRRYDPGDTATLQHEVRDADGELTSATVVLTLTPPAGEDLEPTVNESSTGVFDAVVADLDAGVYSGYWMVTGSVQDVVPVRFYVAEDDDRLPPLASFDQLARKLGYTPEDAERTRAEDILDSASELIRDVAGKTWVSTTTGVLESVPRRVRSICVEVAYRAFGNPQGLSQRTIGDDSKSFDRAKREGGEAVYLTTAEEKAIRKAAAGSSLVSVTLVSPYSGEIEDPWDAVTAE